MIILFARKKIQLPEEQQLKDARAPKGGQSEFVNLSPRQKNMSTPEMRLEDTWTNILEVHGE